MIKLLFLALNQLAVILWHPL